MTDITPFTVLAFLRQHTRPARYHRALRSEVAEAFITWAELPDNQPTRRLFAAALRGAVNVDPALSLTTTNRGPAIVGVRLADELPRIPPDAPNLIPFLAAKMEQADDLTSIARDDTWDLYCEWAGDIEPDNEYARRRFFAAMRRRCDEVCRKGVWYYRGARAKGTAGTTISPSFDRDPVHSPIQPAITTGGRPPTTSTMCWRDEHDACTRSGAKCDCSCHGPAGQVPTPRPATLSDMTESVAPTIG